MIMRLINCNTQKYINNTTVDIIKNVKIICINIDELNAGLWYPDC